MIFTLTICFLGQTTAFANTEFNLSLEDEINDCIIEMYQIIQKNGEQDSHYLMSMLILQGYSFDII